MDRLERKSINKPNVFSLDFHLPLDSQDERVFYHKVCIYFEQGSFSFKHIKSRVGQRVGFLCYLYFLMVLIVSIARNALIEDTLAFFVLEKHCSPRSDPYISKTGFGRCRCSDPRKTLSTLSKE